MNRMHVLVVSPGSRVGEWLGRRLAESEFRVTTARPGPELIRAARDRPPVAVLDGVHARPGARLEVALLKDHNPAVRIIALSDESSPQDGEVIEQGIHCYLAGCSLEELLRVIESFAHEPAAAQLETSQPKPRSAP